MNKVLRSLPNGKWIRIFVLQFCYWMVMAFGAYQNVFLQSEGMSATAIGTLNSLLSLITIVVTPVWGLISDKSRSIKKVFLLTLAVGSALFAFLPNAYRHMALPLFFVYAGITYVFKNPYNSLFDNWTIRYCVQNRLNYGGVRWAGSLSWFLTSLAIAGFVAKHVDRVFMVCGIGMILVFAQALFLDDAVPAETKGKKESFNPLVLFKNYYYMTFMVFALIMYLVYNSFMTYSSFLLEDLGLPLNTYSLMTAVAALLEIPMLLGSGWLRTKVKLVWLVVGGATLILLSSLWFGFVACNVPTVLIGTACFGLGNGLFIASIANYVFMLVPEHLKATGQSVFVAVTAFSGIMAGMLAGRMIDLLTAVVFYRILACITVVSLVYLLATLFVGKARRIPGAV